ncbi:MAG: DUF6151 family protein [Paracoccaceae bacterium]|nr:DUF6151 family protein [Paracoccaceae bacterium]MDG2258796.1 DUF6151 family protein [Paracoccaceae bacterium]
MTRAKVPFSCDCGQVHGTINEVAPNRGNLVTCYCKSCQTAANILGYTETLDKYGGTEVFQTVPSKITFLSGDDKLACLRLSPKGLLRWYASCCDAPLFSMPNANWYAIAGVNMARVDAANKDAFGKPVSFHATKSAQNPPIDLKDFGVKRAFVRLTWRALKAALRRDSGKPFFTETGEIAVAPRVVTLEERRAATPD